MSGSCTDVLVIGGGASGTLVAAQLLRQAAGRLRVSRIEPRHQLGRGVACGTTDPGHLLNVMAGRMSALPDEPDHLCRWAGAEPTAFLPRRRYGDYLWSVVDAARDDAAPGVVLEHVRARAVAVRPAGEGFVVDLARGSEMHARSVVIVTGNGPARPLAGVLPQAEPGVIDDPWWAAALAGIASGETQYGDVLLNCTGPTPDPARTDSPLLTQLLADGLARPEALGLGIDVDPDSGALIGHGGRARAGLVTLGPLLRGALWESTAMPEIRVQARDAAAGLLSGARRGALSA